MVIGQGQSNTLSTQLFLFRSRVEKIANILHNWLYFQGKKKLIIDVTLFFSVSYD